MRAFAVELPAVSTRSLCCECREKDYLYVKLWLTMNISKNKCNYPLNVLTCFASSGHKMVLLSFSPHTAWYKSWSLHVLSIADHISDVLLCKFISVCPGVKAHVYNSFIACLSCEF